MAHHPTPPWLHEKPIVLPDGSTALWSYDTEGDILEIFFEKGAASATAEIADGIFLRYNWQQRRPLSLSFISFTPLLKGGEFGPYLLRLDGLNELTPDLRQIVLGIITSLPVSYFLKVYSYLPAPGAKSAIPVAALDQRVA